MVRHGDDLSPLKDREAKAILSHNIHRELPLVESMRHYPERFPIKLERLLSEFKGVSQSSLMVTAGATAAFYMLASAFRRKVEVLILEPAYSGYEEAFAAYGHTVINLDLGLDFDIESLVIPESVEVIILGNPNNPTGTYQDLQKWLSRYPKKLFIIDESFIQFTDEKYSVRALATKSDQVVVIESLTKFYGMAGVRLGVLYGSSQIISALKRYQVPWAVTATEEFVSGRLEKTETLFNLYVEEKNFIYGKLNALGIKYHKGAANYYLLELEDEAFVYEGLLNQGILTRRVHNFKGIDNRYLRVAVGTREENEALLSALIKLQLEKGVL